MKKAFTISVKQASGIITVTALIALIAWIYTFNNPSYPMFSFDSSQNEGWTESKNINLQKVAGNNYSGEVAKEKLPIDDFTVHHGDKNGNIPKDGCFVSFSYFNYRLENIDSAYKTYETKKKESGQLKPLGSKDMTTSTYQGDKTYQLRQYDLSMEGDSILSGYEIGFAELDTGYIRIEGVCGTSKDLAKTIPVLNAVTLNK